MSNPTLVGSPVPAASFLPINWAGDVCTQLKQLLGTSELVGKVLGWLLDPATGYLSQQATLPLQQEIAIIFGPTVLSGGSLSGGYDAYSAALPYYPFSDLQPGIYFVQANANNGDGASKLTFTWTPPTGIATGSPAIPITVRGVSLSKGQIQANGWYLLVYNGGTLELLNPGTATPVLGEEAVSPLFSVDYASVPNPVYAFSHGLSGKAKLVRLVGVAQNVVGPINVGDELDASAFFYQDGVGFNFGQVFAIQNTATQTLIRATLPTGVVGWGVKLDSSGGVGNDRHYNYQTSDWKFYIRCLR